MKKLSLFLLSLIFVFTISCNNEEAVDENAENENGTVTTEAVTFNTADEMVEAAKAQIEEINSEKLKEMMDAEEDFLLIDIRTESEFKKGYILSSVHIPRGVLEFRIKKESFWEDEMLYMPNPEDLIILQCKSGKRGALAALTLKSMGFTNVKNLSGGYLEFKELYPDAIEKPIAEEGDMSAGGEEDSGGC